jgi:Na+-transporting methylmalonyl-CoA/oxaloacetate decarboxylase beta subunit
MLHLLSAFNQLAAATVLVGLAVSAAAAAAVVAAHTAVQAIRLALIRHRETTAAGVLLEDMDQAVVEQAAWV